MKKSKITRQRVLDDFNKLKKYAEKCYVKKDYKQCLCAIKTASNLMYNFNLFYTDDELENLILKIGRKIFIPNNKAKSFNKNKKIIFYDFFSIDNRGLTQQYITALIELGYEILFITYEQKNMKKSERIFLQLSKYEKAKIYTIKNKDIIESAKELYKVVDDYDADSVLFHTAPWDIVGILTFSQIENIDRYMINITDHAFWLGKCCSDYFIEFRSYGYNISCQYRNIPKEKINLLPYYPIQDFEIPFAGFPFDAADKKIIFSGGSLYKIYGSDVFFNTIKHIISKYNDTIFLYAGGGDREPFIKFIEDNGLNEKVYLISERKDITQLFKNCYFYLGTYPIGGGLMTQYAVANGKIPMVYSDKKIKTGAIESLFINLKDVKFTHASLNEFYKGIDKLLEDKEYKIDLEKKLDDLIIKPIDFAENLKLVLMNKRTTFKFEEEEIDNNYINEFSKVYFSMENDYSHNYFINFLSSKNIRLIIKFISIEMIIKLIKELYKKIKIKIKK